MSIYSCQSGNMFVGERPTARYAGLVNPANYQTTLCVGHLKKAPIWRT
mgnify:CR=1 FL=1